VKKMDELVTGSAANYTDRLGVDHLTASGAMARFAALNPRGAWVTATLYQPRDLVLVSGTWYLALDTHTSGATFAGDLSAHWRPEQGVTAADLSNLVSATKGAGQLGLGILGYAADTVGGAVFTTVWGGGATDRAAALTAANALGLPIRIIGACTVSSPVTLTVPIVDTMVQIFQTTAQITVDNKLPVRPEWFGTAAGNIRLAVDCLPAAGGTVLLESKVYPPSYDTATGGMFNARGGTPGVDYMVKKNVRIMGRRLPGFNAANTALVNGSIIAGGAFYVASECDGFQIDLVGVDVGLAATGGVLVHDGFCILQVNKTTPYYGINFHVGAVVSLGAGVTSLGHAVLIESIEYSRVDYAEGRCNSYGVVLKCRNMTACTLIGRSNNNEDVYLKSDVYAEMGNLAVETIVAVSPMGSTGYSFLIEAAALSAANINIGSVQAEGRVNGVAFVTQGAFLLTDANIKQVITRQCPNGIVYQGAGPSRCRVARADITAATAGVVSEAASVSITNGVDNLAVTNATYGVYCNGKISIGDYQFENVTNGLYWVVSTARIFVSGCGVEVAVSNPSNSQPALAGTWANVGTEDAYAIKMRAGEVIFEGMVSSGGSNVLTTLPVQLRPARPLRFALLYYTGSVYELSELIVDTTGIVYVMKGAMSSPKYVSLRGVRFALPT
jgi:hypothetical protein